MQTCTRGKLQCYLTTSVAPSVLIHYKKKKEKAAMLLHTCGAIRSNTSKKKGN